MPIEQFAPVQYSLVEAPKNQVVTMGKCLKLLQTTKFTKQQLTTKTMILNRLPYKLKYG